MIGSRVAAAEPETIAGIAVIGKNQILPLIHADDRRSKKKQHLAMSNWQLEHQTIAGIAVIARHRRNRKNQILPLIHAGDRRSKKKHLAISNWQLEQQKPILLHNAQRLKPNILKTPYAALKSRALNEPPLHRDRDTASQELL